MTVLEPVIGYLSTLKPGVKCTLTQVIEGAERPRKPVLRVMDRLVREGYLLEIEDDKIAPKYGEVGRCRRNPTWKLVSHPVYVNPKAPKRRTVRDRLWKAMRDKRRFTRKELMRIADCSLGSAENYTKLLEHHQVIRVISQYGNRKTYILAIRQPPKDRPLFAEVKKKNVRR